MATIYLYNRDTFFIIRSRQILIDYLLRYIHANLASLIFICLYVHVGRGIYYISFKKPHTWNIGVGILLLIMATAFLGYVLPSNQISYWGASVITSLVSEIPYFGLDLMNFLWGDWIVREPLYSRFFSFHYFLPLVILSIVILHIFFLHEKGSRRPLGNASETIKKKFQFFFIVSDALLLIISFSVFLILSIRGFNAWDPDVFALSDRFITPFHIQPEWYFLFAYAILRAIPRKLGGFIALVLSILILYSIPYLILGKSRATKFYPIHKFFFLIFFLNSTIINMSRV